jgi:uncharacterized membrane protein YhhN
VATDLHRLRLAGKTVLMPALAARSLGAPRGHRQRRVLVAQACSWGGDIALNGRGRGPFLCGLGLFLGAHLAYISAFRSRSSTPLLSTPARRRFLAIGGVASVAMATAAGRTDRVLAAPVAVYGMTLCTMTVAAAAVDSDRGRDRVLAGAALFLLSDTLIGVRRFLAGDRGAALEAGVMASYAAAQWCIGEAMLR